MDTRAIVPRMRNKKRSENEAAHQVLDSSSGGAENPIAILEVKPHENTRISLGIFDKHKPPKGFMISTEPDPDPIDSLVSNVVALPKEKANQYELMLFLENFGSRIVLVEIWEI